MRKPPAAKCLRPDVGQYAAPILDRVVAMLRQRTQVASTRCHAFGLDAVLVLITLVLTPAYAFSSDLTPKDVQVIGRVLGFLERPLQGTVRLGVVFSPAVSASVREANMLRDLLASGMSAGKPTGKVVLEPALIPISELARAGDIDAIFITTGLGPTGKAIAEKASRMHIPTLGTDFACAATGDCLLAFRSDPTVEIVISRSAADMSKVRFIPAFQMLVTEY